MRISKERIFMNISAINSINFGSHKNENNLNNGNYKRLLRKYNINNDSFDKGAFNSKAKSNKSYYLNEQLRIKKSDIKAKLNLNTEEASDVKPKFSLSEEEIKKQIKEYEKEIFELKESLSSSKNEQEYQARWERITYLEAEIKKLKKLL